MTHFHLSDTHRRNNDLRMETDDFFQRHHRQAGGRSSSPTPSSTGRQQHRWYYQRLQFRRMYRYGLSLLLVGALCNWIGFAQHYFSPVRYLGVGCVIAGALCISIALCRWLAIRSNEPTIGSHEMSGCGGGPSIHVIAVPIQGMDPFHPASIHSAHHAPPMTMMKPPDYETAIGSKPPSYDEAVRVHPAVFLQLNTPAENPSTVDIPDPAAVPASVPPPSPTSGVNHRPPCCTIDCPHCSGNGA